MGIGQERLWKGEAIVEPKVEWGKIGIDSFEFGADESITLENQFEDKTLFSVNVIADEEGVHAVYARAELLMKSFLALLGMEAGRVYKCKIGHMRPVQSVRSKDGYLLDTATASFRVVPAFEDLDLSLLKGSNSLLKRLDIEKRDVMLEALNFVYDAISASTSVHSLLSLYGGLSYLTATIGRKETSLDSAEETLSMFRNNGVLNECEEGDWWNKFKDFHTLQYKVIKSNKVKYEELREIKAYFKKFFLKCMEYFRIVA